MVAVADDITLRVYRGVPLCYDYNNIILCAPTPLIQRPPIFHSRKKKKINKSKTVTLWRLALHNNTNNNKTCDL